MGSFNTAEAAERGGRKPGKIEASLNEELSNVEWGEYKLGDLFEVKSYKKRFDANKVQLSDKGHPYIVRMSTDNGRKGFIEEDEVFLNEGNTLSFGQDTATVFYQEKKYFTGDKIKILKPLFEQFNKSNAQFFVAAITQAFQSFAWGTSSFSIETIEKQNVQLPTLDGKINFSFMEKFIAKLEAQRIVKLEAYLSVTGLKDYELTGEEQKALREYKNIEWGEFRLNVLFERVQTKKLPYKADDLPKQAIGRYILPCLTSSFRNQGLNYFAPKHGATILKNVVSIPSNSDVYRAYYQSNEFTVLSDAYAIRWIYDEIQLLPSQYLYVVSCINKVTDLSIYSYKNKLGGWKVVQNKYIRLPVKKDKPDYKFMDTLITAIQKLVIKDVVRYTDQKIRATKKLI